MSACISKDVRVHKQRAAEETLVAGKNIQRTCGCWDESEMLWKVMLKKRREVSNFGLNVSLLRPNLPAVPWTRAQSPAAWEQTQAADQQTVSDDVCLRNMV